MTSSYLLLLVAMVAIFYLLVYRPQQRAKREKEALMRSLAVGVEVVTVGGIYGEVAALREEDLDLEVAEGIVMRVDRRAIASIASAPAEEEDEDDDDDEDLEDEELEGDEEWEDEDDEDGEWEDDEDEEGEEADADEAPAGEAGSGPASDDAPPAGTARPADPA